MWLFNIENDALSPWEEHQLTLILVSFNIIFALSLVLACLQSHCFIRSYAQEKDDIVVLIVDPLSSFFFFHVIHYRCMCLCSWSLRE